MFVTAGYNALDMDTQENIIETMVPLWDDSVLNVTCSTQTHTAIVLNGVGCFLCYTVLTIYMCHTQALID